MIKMKSLNTFKLSSVLITFTSSLQMYTMRNKYVRPEEEKIWASVSVHDMSDEEDTDDGFLHVSPVDRSDELKTLIRLLDERHAERQQKENRRIMKVKRIKE